MARAASSEARAGMIIGIPAGASAHAIAAELRSLRGATVVTNSLAVASVLCGSDFGPEVIMLPGTLNSGGAFVGELCARELASVRLDVAFISGHGFDAEAMAFLADFAHSEGQRAFALRSDNTVVMAPSSTWASRSGRVVFAMDDIAAIASDRPIPEPVLARATEAGVRLIIPVAAESM